MTLIEYQHHGYVLSTDKVRLDLQVIYTFLTQSSYWAQQRSFEVMQKSIENSLCFGIYTAQGQQAGFARVVTDYATFAWLCDVFILEAHRGQGLGKWLVESAVNHPDLQGLKTFLLATRDAQELYHCYGGFKLLPNPENWMIRRKSDGP